MDYIKIIKANPVGVLATQKEKGVCTRIVHSFFMDDDKVMFSTSSDKPMYEQMTANPNVSFCVHSDNYKPVISIQGEVVWIEDHAWKERILDRYAMFRNIYKTADNPIFKPFYIHIADVSCYVSGEGTSLEQIQ